MLTTHSWLLLLLASLAPLRCHADQPRLFASPYERIARGQIAYHDNGDVRASVSIYAASAARAFVLFATDWNYDVGADNVGDARAQLFFGAPVSSRLRWLGVATRFDYVKNGENSRGAPLELFDTRIGPQVSVHEIPFAREIFQTHRADLIVQLFTSSVASDFGAFDTFIRFSKRFTPTLQLRGVLRSYHFDDAAVVTIENDLIYKFQPRWDLFFRAGKGNRDFPGLSQRDLLLGVGVRFNCQ